MRIRQLLPEIKTPVQRAMTLLAPHFGEIRTAWRKRLASMGIGEDALDALYPLTLEAQQHHLRAGNMDAYQQELETQGQVLERAGISQAHSAAALGFCLEISLPYILSPEKKGNDMALALSRLIAMAQVVTLSSSAKEGAANWRKFQERERQDLSRDLHDDIGHNLLVLKLYLEIMASDLKRGEIAPLQSKLEEALALVSSGVESVRRLILDQGPAMLAQFGFLPALRIYSRQFSLRTGIQVHFEEGAVPESLPPSYETVLYRVLQGALSNVVKHSQAQHVRVRLGSIKNSVLLMSIEDDGTGFDVASAWRRPIFGLTAMRERIERIGGKFHIESWPSRPGSRKHGTRIEVDLPLRD